MADYEEETGIAEPGKNGDNPDYRQTIEHMINSGFQMPDGNVLARDGMQLLGATSQQRQAAIHYLASVGKADEIYKDNKKMALLLDMMARGVFTNRRERIAFLDYVEWCVEFEVDLDNAIRYIVSSISENGRSREELLAAMNSFNYVQTSRQYNYAGKKPKGNRDGRLD